MPVEGLGVLLATLALGTPVLSLIGAVGAALTLGVRGSGVLTALLVLPLYIPVLILGAGGVHAASAGMDASAHLMLLGALLLFAATCALWPIAAALRIAVE
jgi:heme exporter protein B